MSISEFISRLEALEKLVDDHIHDGIGVWKALEGLKTDLLWIKRGIWAIIGLLTILSPLFVKFVMARALNN